MKPTHVALIVGLMIATSASTVFVSNCFESSEGNAYPPVSTGADSTPEVKHVAHASERIENVDENLESLKLHQFEEGTPEFVLQKYVAAQTWQERRPLVRESNELTSRLRSHYGTRPLSTKLLSLVRDTSSLDQKAGIVRITATFEGRNNFGVPTPYANRYFLKEGDNGYKIMWEESVGWLPIGWAPFLAQRPTNLTDLQVKCELTNNYFSFNDATRLKRSHYEISVKPDTTGSEKRLTAYVLKESSAGKRLFKLLQDGKPHSCVLTLQFQDDSTDEVAFVRAVVSDEAYIYNPGMKQSLVSDIESPPAQIEQAKELAAPIAISKVSANWKISQDVLGAKSLLVPEVRFRVDVKGKQNVDQLTMKMVYLAKQDDSTEILHEDIQYTISTSNRALTKGFSKQILSESARGYVHKSVTSSAAVIRSTPVRVEIYFDTGDGYRLLETVRVEKSLPSS